MYRQIIAEICEELNIKFNYFSNDWIIMLEKDNQIKYISGYKFDINDQAASLCVDDKYATHDVLKSKNIKVIEHTLLYDEDNFEPYAKNYKDRKIAIDYFNNHNQDIVIKGNTSTCGMDVYHIKNESDINKALDNIFKHNLSASLCPFYNIESEYRIIILNHQPRIIYSKVRPIVYGNGIDKISILLHTFNPSYNYNVKDDQVLSKNEKYIYSWQHNLSNGAKIDLNIDDTTKTMLANMAIKISEILNLNFGSIDIVKVDNEYLVLECNSGVMMDNLVNILPDGYNIAKDIYREAITKMFE